MKEGKNLERGGAAGEAGKSMCRASLRGGYGHVLQVYLGSR